MPLSIGLEFETPITLVIHNADETNSHQTKVMHCGFNILSVVFIQIEGLLKYTVIKLHFTSTAQ